MRILFVSSGNSEKGISPIVLNQGISIERQGLSVSYFTVKGKGIKGYLKNVSPLKKAIKEQKIDIIHAHYGLIGILVFLAQLLKRTHVPLVVSYMGDDLLGSNKKDGSLTFSSKVTVFINCFLAKYYNDWNIVKSSKMAKILGDNMRMTIAPNGIDFSMFYPLDQKTAREKLNLEKSKKIVLFAADPNRPEKNYKLTYDAVGLLKSKNLELVKVHGLSQDQLLLYYNAADVIAMSSFHEGSPNVIKEAMACNRPIVTTNVGDVEEVIGKTEGCFIASYDPSDFAEKLNKALLFDGSTSGKQQIGHLESSIVAKEIIQLYGRLLN